MKNSSPRIIGKHTNLVLDSLIPRKSNIKIKEDDHLRGLATSITEVGLIYPIIVKPDAEQEGFYRIIVGQRRWQALKLLKMKFAPCIVISANEHDGKAQAIHVVENHQRKNPDPFEEAGALRGLLNNGLELEAVARLLGSSRAWVSRRVSF